MSRLLLLTLFLSGRCFIFIKKAREKWCFLSVSYISNFTNIIADRYLLFSNAQKNFAFSCHFYLNEFYF